MKIYDNFHERSDEKKICDTINILILYNNIIL